MISRLTSSYIFLFFVNKGYDFLPLHDIIMALPCFFFGNVNNNIIELFLVENFQPKLEWGIHIEKKFILFRINEYFNLDV